MVLIVHEGGIEISLLQRITTDMRQLLFFIDPTRARRSACLSESPLLVPAAGILQDGLRWKCLAGTSAPR